MNWRIQLILGFLLAAPCPFLAPPLHAQDTNDLKKEVDELREQNRLLQKQVQQQQEMIDQLGRKFSNFESNNQAREKSEADADAEGAKPPPKSGNFSVGNVIITGEGGAGVFDTQAHGKYPNAPFRVQEARLFFDAPIWEDVYFYGQVDLLTMQSYENQLTLGELYVQFENLTKRWGVDDLLNVRVGQFYIPFGEEYEYRFAIDNPLISHSLSDLWGYDPGLELYGSWRKLSYVASVQNGGLSTLNANTADKAIVGRVGYDPLSWLHLSASAMRTGDLSATKDASGLWFGGGLFKSIGAPTASVFDVNLAELDAAAHWQSGHLKLAGGYAGYDDDNTIKDDHRDIYYYYAEALQHATRKLYGVARFSQIHAERGYPIMGDAPSPLSTSELWRLSLGLGYELNPHVVLKAEYMFEQGQLSAGGARDHENLIAAEAAFKF